MCSLNTGLGNTSLTGIGNGTVTGAISSINSKLSNQIVVNTQTFDFTVGANAQSNISFNAESIDGYTVCGIVALMFWTGHVLLVGNYINNNTINIRLKNSASVAISSTGIIKLLYSKK